MDKTDKLKSRKHWTTPALKIYGTMGQITQQDKALGNSDGIFLLTVGEITNAS